MGRERVAAGMVYLDWATTVVSSGTKLQLGTYSCCKEMLLPAESNRTAYGILGVTAGASGMEQACRMTQIHVVRNCSCPQSRNRTAYYDYSSRSHHDHSRSLPSCRCGYGFQAYLYHGRNRRLPSYAPKVSIELCC
jgi:hypothetical protein